MTTYYVGAGGDNGNAGTSWAQRKQTLNGAEDIPVVAGDTIYVGPGVYGGITCDVSGSSGSPITYIGDYTGQNTDGVGGVVRINDSIASSAKDYRTFKGFTVQTGGNVAMNVTGSNWIIEDCAFVACLSYIVRGSGTGSTDWTVRRCLFINNKGNNLAIEAAHTSTVDNANWLIENCASIGQGLFVSARVGGVTIKNSISMGGAFGIRVGTALSAGQTITVNNCIITSAATYGLSATTTGEITEDYNAVNGNGTDRFNVSTGANSNAAMANLDTRWFHELTNGGTLLSPLDLASYSGLVELNSGTGAASADMRGNTGEGTYREWGPLEYDSALAIEAGAGSSGGMGGIFGSIVR